LKDGGQDSLDEVMTLSDGEVIFWNKVNRDPFFMYLEDSIDFVDQKWVEHNRKVVKFQENSVKDIDLEEDFIERNGHDYAFHAALPID
jgi:chloramphenicol O-acetyltransferase